MRSTSTSNRPAIEWRTRLLTRIIPGFLIFSLFLHACAPSTAGASPWKKLVDGLFLGEFIPKKKSKVYNDKIIVLKIDPSIHSLKLLSATEHGQKTRTAKQWCETFGMRAVINAGMYQNADLLKSTGYMKNYHHINNSHINKNYGALLVFNPIDPSLPSVRILDRQLRNDWKELIKKYHTVVQNYRMISAGVKIGWQQSDSVYSSTSIGTDDDGNVLFIFNRTPYSTHDLILALLSLPLHIVNAMYVEGGPDATLYLDLDDRIKKGLGSRKSSILHAINSESTPDIPNVIGIMKQ